MKLPAFNLNNVTIEQINNENESTIGNFLQSHLLGNNYNWIFKESCKSYIKCTYSLADLAFAFRNKIINESKKTGRVCFISDWESIIEYYVSLRDEFIDFHSSKEIDWIKAGLRIMKDYKIQ